MRRPRLVKPGEQPVDRLDAALGRDHRLGPPAAAAHPPGRVDRGLQRPDHRRADRDDPPAAAAYRVDADAPSTARTSKRSAYGGSSASGEATPVCSVIGSTATPRAASSVTSIGGERPAGARHLGAAGVPGEHGLVRVERPAPVDVAVPDRPTVPAEIPDDVGARRRARCAARPARAGARGRGRAAGAGAPPGSRSSRLGGSPAKRSPNAAQLDQPGPTRAARSRSAPRTRPGDRPRPAASPRC